jgi:FixJ family two-component response regulator
MSSELEQVVYVVDDDADVREGVGALLESIGLQVVALSSTAEFLAQKRAARLCG